MAIKISNQTVIYDDEVFRVGSGTNAERPETPSLGMFRYNTDLDSFEGYDGTEWGKIGGGFEVTNDTSTDSTYYPVFVDSTTGEPTQTSISSDKLNFNPSSGNFSATQFTSLSDASKKTNVRPIENSIELTKQLEGVRFDWIENNKPSLGLIAQEVEKILPELVVTNTDGTKSVSYGNIIGVLIEAIKEQQVRIENLEKKING
jgi:hypothetical protein